MVITTNYGAILVSCYDSDVVSIYGYSGHSELLPNHFQPFSKIWGNLPMVQPLLPISPEFSFFLRIFPFNQFFLESFQLCLLQKLQNFVILFLIQTV